MATVGKLKKAAFYFKLKELLKAVMVILHAMCSVLEMPQRIWYPSIPEEFNY